MAGHVTEVTDGDFEAEVLNSEIPTIVDFWAEWCGPCKAIAPALSALAEAHEGQVKVVKLNVDHNNQTPMNYKVTALPTFMAFSGGEVVGQLRGARKSDLENLFAQVAG